MPPKPNLTRAILLIIIAILFVVVDYYKKDDTGPPTIPSESTATIERAFQNRQSNVQVSGSGEVTKLLPDDLEGSKHQKFIVRLSPNLTVLIAHNIDLAPRVHSLRKGDQIAFAGEYEYNARGGVVHWTHHDPGKRHPDGWLKYNGKIYR